MPEPGQHSNGRPICYRQQEAVLLALPGDVTSQADVDSLVREVQQRFGGLDLLCNCAGRSTRGEVLDTTTEVFKDLWEDELSCPLSA